MNYAEYNINIGTETHLEGLGEQVSCISFRFHKNGIPYKIVKLK